MKKILTVLAVGLSWLTVANAAWPEKPVTVIVPFPPGGSTDNVARLLSARLQEKLGQTFLVDNRAGATGTIGAAYVKRAAADGYTLFISSLGPFVIAPHLIKGLSYDTQKDFDYITVAVQAPNVLAVPASSPFKSLTDVIAFEKTNPGKMTFASSGNGSSDHLTAELFWQLTGTKGSHIPYKGGAPAITDLLGGQVDATFMNINTAVPYVKSGKFRALAVTSAKRSPVLPDVPTTDEAGLKGFTVYSWQAVAAPKGLPPAVKAKLHSTLVEILNEREVRSKLQDVGFEIVANTPEQFAAYQAAEFARWKKVIDTGKIKAD